jgi:saccharopine dehydrogenase-like NADP-dependent oxidoreductase
MKDILEHAVPTTLQDVVIIFVAVAGHKDGRLVQETYANRIYSRPANGVMRSAVQLTTASSIAAVLDLLANGKLPRKGFVRQEDITLDALLQNRFGRIFATMSQPSAEAAE